MTLRKYYLLLGEWYAQRKVEDYHWWNLILAAGHFKEAPVASSVFPLLSSEGMASSEQPDDEELSFHQVVTALAPSIGTPVSEKIETSLCPKN